MPFLFAKLRKPFRTGRTFRVHRPSGYALNAKASIEERHLLDDVSVFGLDFALALSAEALAAFVEVFLVEFTTHVVKAHLVGCDTA